MFLGSVSEARFLVSMPLWFRPARLIYFFDQVRCLAEYDAALVDLHILTSTYSEHEKAAVLDLLVPFASDKFRISIHSFWDDNDQKKLTWIHRDLIKYKFINNVEFTHFIYMEDDIRMSVHNMRYFIENRPLLDPLGFIPSFLRFEYNFSSLKLYTTDVVGRSSLAGKTIHTEGKTFVMAGNPYCAAYVLDQELAAEFVYSRSFDRELSRAVIGWPDTERSAMGLCFENPPPGHISRFKIAVDVERNIPALGCLIHHLPNNFTNRDWPEGHTPFGKTELLSVFSREA